MWSLNERGKWQQRCDCCGSQKDEGRFGSLLFPALSADTDSGPGKVALDLCQRCIDRALCALTSKTDSQVATQKQSGPGQIIF